jgi:hypothetical protein
MYLVFHILPKHVLHAGATDAQYVLRMHPMRSCADIVRGYALSVLNYAYVEHRHAAAGHIDGQTDHKRACGLHKHA